ncbi:CPBP family intramembrane metalloprotease [Lactobacillus sp. ESL0791]|uniref:CPBP family intramembrane glutamic endopeptidase n=1 Tax=Lactobacillus sp. ESL0791 TaxID=2983234 RepID=UPI0023F9B403|nr:CPBP family intramembrane glutamic endopeptidase [Lactobacillus sp. ESL0791]MDF7637865.1 CPBP family intramembrane metalloprotease [Lactobacillus sp. ESL0791]
MKNIKTKSGSANNIWVVVVTIIIYLAALMTSKLLSFFSNSNVFITETVLYLVLLVVMLVFNKKVVKLTLFVANWHFPFSVWLIWLLDILKTLLMPGILLGIALGLGGRFGSGIDKGKIVLVLVMLLSIVLFEEITVHGILLPSLVKVLQQHKHCLLVALLINVLVFGFAHLFDPILVPMLIPSKSIVVAIFHAIETAASGLILGAIYLRSKNLVLPVLLQFILYPIEYFLLGTTHSAELKILPLILYVLLCICAAVYLIRRIKPQEWLNSAGA